MEEFNESESQDADEKLRLMRAKADQYNIKLTDVQMLDVLENHSKLANTDNRRSLAEKKVEFEAMKYEQQITLAK